MPRRLVSIITLVVLQFMSYSLWAEEVVTQTFSPADSASNGGFLSPDQAFQFSYQQQGEEIRLHWQIAPGYYLYQTRLKLSDTNKSVIDFETSSQAEEKDDPNFGLVQVFHNQLDLALKQPELENNRLMISYQGCAEEGLCYPPKRKTIALNPRPSTASNPPSIAASIDPSSNASIIKTSLQSTPSSTDQSVPTAIAIDQQDVSQDSGAITRMLTNAEGYWVLLTFLLLGLGLTFTPCVLPMVPILAGIIAGQGSQITLRKGIGLSVAYVLGMSVTYTLAGVLVGFFGARLNLQAALQTPLALMMFAGLFTVLALSMFGFYELQLPAVVRDRLDRMGRESKGGQYAGVALMGLISALVVSPCVSAPLAGALVYISTTGDALMGGASLFALSMGMGLPLILVGAGGGKLLPKAGGWMLEVKAFFGVLMLGVAISLLSRLLPGEVSLLLWALLAIVYAIHLGGFGQLESLSNWGKTRRGLSVALLAYGISLLLAGLAGQEDPLRPLAFVSSPGSSSSVAAQPLFARYRSVAELEGALKQARLENMPVVVDLYADWCASCKVMEKEVFNQAAVKSLGRQVTFLQLDITNNTDEQTSFLEKHGLFGPPSLLFYQASGAELVSARVQGELGAPEFIQQLQKVL